MSKLIIKKSLLGHNCSITGYSGGTPYLYAKQGAIDNINRHHAELYAICDECNKEFLVANIHTTLENKLNYLKEKK